MKKSISILFASVIIASSFSVLTTSSINEDESAVKARVPEPWAVQDQVAVKARVPEPWSVQDQVAVKARVPEPWAVNAKA